MKRTPLLYLLLYFYSASFAQCEPKPVEFILDDLTDTIIIEGFCGYVNDFTKLNPKDFAYMNGGSRFVINCDFAKNCGQGGYITVQKNNDSLIIDEHIVDTGEVMVCMDYDEFLLTFPMPSSGEYYVQISGFDTIISGLTANAQNLIDEFEIFPNPFNDFININTRLKANENEFQIYDLNGKIKFYGYLFDKQNQIDLSSLSKGLYLFNLKTEEGLIYRKIIKE